MQSRYLSSDGSALMLSFLAACGKKDEESSAGSSAAESEKDGTVSSRTDESNISSSVSDSKILIVYFSRWGNTDYPEDIDASASASIIMDGEHFGTTEYEYYPSWEPPVSCLRATREWYFPPSEPPQHLVAAYIFDFTINLLIVVLGELLMQYRQIIYKEVFLCLRRQRSEVFWNFWEKI